MIVVCKRPTKRLIKGVRYEVENLWNDGTSQRWVEGRVDIKDVGKFCVANFVDENGNELPKIKIVKPLAPIQRMVFSDLKEGDILVCTSDNYKTLLKGGMYRIEKLHSISTQKTGWNNMPHNYTEQHIKFEGVTRKLKFNTWTFRQLNSEESREISLNTLLHDDEAPVIKSQNIKKIDLMSNKDTVLMEILSKSIIDPNRHHLTIPEWACEKVASKLSLEVSDFDYLMDMSLRDILTLLETNK
jgi:hypothetical protein